MDIPVALFDEDSLPVVDKLELIVVETGPLVVAANPAVNVTAWALRSVPEMVLGATVCEMLDDAAPPTAKPLHTPVMELVITHPRSMV